MPDPPRSGWHWVPNVEDEALHPCLRQTEIDGQISSDNDARRTAAHREVFEHSIIASYEMRSRKCPIDEGLGICCNPRSNASNWIRQSRLRWIRRMDPPMRGAEGA